VSSEKKAAKEVQELIDLLDVAKLVVSTLEMHHVLDAILKSAMKLTATNAGSIALFHKESNELEIMAHRGFSEDFAGNTRWKVRPGGLTDKILKSKKPTVISNTTNKRFFTNPLALKEGIKSMVCVPLVFNDDIIGIFYVDDFSPRAFNKGELRLLYILSTFAAMSIDHAQLHEKTKKMAITDGLTGLYNHRHFQEELTKEATRAERYDDKFSLLMIDIDDFKSLNDDYGHPFGDKVLQKLSEVLKASVRETDMAARYGGEEFTVLLPKVDSAQALTMARRITRQIKAKTASLMRGKRPFTVSIGIASFPADARERLELIQNADKALYTAKARGKNRIVEFQEITRSCVA